jgi:hypothetical protein
MDDKDIESRVIELAQTICRLHREDKNVGEAVKILGKVSDRFVISMYEYLSEQADAHKAEQQILDLIRSVYRLHQECRTWPAIIEMIMRQDYQNFSLWLILEIYNQFPKNVQTPMKEHQQNAEKALYYEVSYERSKSMTCWTDRYILLYKDKSPQSHLHDVELIDSYNDKSM